MVLKPRYLPTPEEIALATAKLRQKHLQEKKACNHSCHSPKRGVTAYRLRFTKTDGFVFDIANG